MMLKAFSWFGHLARNLAPLDLARALLLVTCCAAGHAGAVGSAKVRAVVEAAAALDNSNHEQQSSDMATIHRSCDKGQEVDQCVTMRGAKHITQIFYQFGLSAAAIQTLRN
jgi:hypothetical protein